MDMLVPNPAFLLLQNASGEALDCLTRSRLSDSDVHSARKALKKARAALRLLRPALAPRLYREENISLRDAGRCLSPLRDARILMNTLESLDSGGLRFTTAEIIKLRHLLEQRLAEAHKAVMRPETLRRCSSLVESTRERFGRQELAEASADTLNAGFLNIYRKARKAFLDVRNAKTSGSLHEWRKQTKYLRTAAATLQETAGGELKKTSERANDISDWLGDDHDLAVLSELTGDLTSAAARELIQSLDEKRAKLQRRALADGEKLFDRKPRKFVAQMLG